MRIADIIRKKRDGGELTEEEIRWFIAGVADGSVPDYQISAFCMAVYFRSMSVEETTALTLAIRDSGEILRLTDLGNLRVDKHSTGGVGDKTSLIVAPIVASLGVKVAKMSGRGLGHTGGTIDKLESFVGLRTDLSPEEFEKTVRQTGIAIVGQNKNLAPADKKLYAIRDVTATVDSLPLIASSIMGKKLAADDDCIVLDVKTGSGSFMKTLEESRALAEVMVQIGKRAGKRMLALITDMDRPLGCSIGNSLEVIEAIETLQGKGPADLTEICLVLASEMLSLAGMGTVAECRAKSEKAIADGSAMAKLAAMVGAQGGDEGWVYDTTRFPRARFSCSVRAPESGFIVRVDTEGYGRASLLLGAGRARAEDCIDHTAGILLTARTGDAIREGDVIATLYANDEALFAESARALLAATVFSGEKPADKPLVLDRIQ